MVMRRALPNPRRCAELIPLLSSQYTVIFRSIFMSLNIDCVPMARLHSLVNASFSLSGDFNAIVDCVDGTVLMQCMPCSMLIEIVFLFLFFCILRDPCLLKYGSYWVGAVSRRL